MGKINWLVVYDEAFDDKSIKAMLKKGPPKPNPPASGGEDELPLTGELLTTDGRVCTGICTTNPLPGMPGAPDPPAGAALGQPDYGPGADVDEGLPEDPNAPPPVVDQINTGMAVKTDTGGDDKAFAGPTGKQFRIECPKGSGSAEGSVIGTMIYDMKSNVCKAAVHAGLVTNDKPGEVIMIIANGEEKYHSSFQNGI